MTAESLWDLLDERDLDISDVAMLTGVEASLLTRIANGEALPDHGHRLAIARVLGSTAGALAETHDHPDPAYVTLRRGALPEGRSLQVVKAGALAEGDMIPYTPRHRMSGTQWVTVDAEPQDQGIFVVVTLGGVEVNLNKESVLRIARA